MTTDSKSQPTGWVVVDFAITSYMPFRGDGRWYRLPECSQLVPFNSESDAKRYVRYEDEVHPWPLPASVLARIKERHPTVDWSQVPVADAPAVAEPSEVEELRKENAYWMEECYHQQAKAERLQAEVERLTRERDEARAELDRTMRERDAMEERVNCIAQELGLSEEECQWSNVNDVGVVAASRAARLLSDVEDLREQLGKARISRRDEFAKAALTGLLSCLDPAPADMFAKHAVELADATIRALDGAGGA